MNLFICFIFEHKSFAADKGIHNFRFLTTHNKYSNQVYIIILIIKNKKTLIRYCNASSCFFSPETVRLNTITLIFLSIIATLSPSTSSCFWRCLCLVVIVGSSLTPAASFCRCSFRIVIVFVSVLLLLLSAASCRYFKGLVYIRLNMRATTMEPQHQSQNGPAAI